MSHWQHLRATVVSVCDDCASRRGRSAHHGSCDFFGPFERNSRYRGSASAKKGTERAGSLSGLKHMRKKANQFRAKWLVKVIGKGTAHFFVISRSKRRGNRTCARTALYCGNARDLRRQNASRACGFDFEIG